MIKKPMKITCLLLILLGTATVTQADTIADLQAKYTGEGAGPFTAESGRVLWQSEQQNSDGKPRSCGACHGSDLRLTGKHVVTGKKIEPMAPSANRQSLTEAGKIEKWFKRNCKWTLGRECSPQEKGDILSYLATQ